ncbi:hypothetical protein [Haloarchaeobius sp. HRN-SO-5]|uniref:hypothetical protein n=1 Tax=Haloarchaeobius sp. HRN-SO-5 TaxID=3446118 RepID=UPI003EB8BD33
MKVPRSHLVPLLNALHRTGTDRIAVSHPADVVGELLEIRLDAPDETEVRLTKDVDDYQATRERVFRDCDESAYEDLPDHSTYVRALTAAGLVPPTNQDDLEGYLDRHGYRDLEHGHPPLVLGIDANVFPWELPSVLGFDHRTGRKDDSGRRATNGYALATGVKEELDWYFKHYDTSSLEAAFGPEFERLSDQPAGSNREGFLGLYAYRKLMATRNVDEVETGTGDESIVDGYATYEAESRKTPLLLSNDYGFVDDAHDAGLLAHHVQFAPVVPRTVEANWREVADLLYFLSVLFGVLVLPKVTIYGVWNGKSGLDWQQELLEVDCRSPKIEPLVDRQLQIVTAYEGRTTS